MRMIDADNIITQIARNAKLSVAQFAEVSEIIRKADAAGLPCKMGDVVWGIRRAYKNRYCVKQGVVNEMYFGEDMRLCICVENVCRGEWGKNVFATKEEAAAEIERRTAHVR